MICSEPVCFKRYAKPPQGGSAADYEEWAAAVPGVTRSWVNPNGMGNGSVVVYVMLDDIESSHGGFPQGTDGVAAAETRAAPATGDQLLVANAILPEQPVTALVYVTSPIADPIDFHIADLFPNTATIQAGITASLTALFLEKGSPLPSVIYPSDVNAAISAVAGVQEFNLISPVSEITNTMGNLPVLGDITFS